jgi:hypothetical protein
MADLGLYSDTDPMRARESQLGGQVGEATDAQAADITESPVKTEAARREILDLAARVAVLEQRSGKIDFQTWTGLLTLFALAIYGAARCGDEAFYARLGTDADTVGLTYGVTLARVATTTAVCGASVLALFLCGRLRDRPQNERSEQGNWTGLLLLGAVVFASILSFLLLILIIPPQLIPVTPVRGIVAAGCVLGIYKAGKRYERIRREKGSFSPISSTIAVAIGLVMLFGLAALTGYHSATYIMRGQTLPCPCVSFFGHNLTLPWSSGTNGFLGIKAELANVRWIGPGKSIVPPFAVLLGESNSSVVLFDMDSQTVRIVPSDDVIVSPQSNLTGWDER